MAGNGALDLLETPEGILLKTLVHPRAGWEEQFKAAGHVEELDHEWLNARNTFDDSEWTW